METVKLWTILFLCIAIQGFFLSFLIATRKNRPHKRADLFLSAFIGLFSTIMLFWVGHWNKLFDAYHILSFIYRPIPLLIGPFLFYYVKSFFEKTDRRDLLHLLPFMIVSAYFLPVYLNYSYSPDIHSLLWKWEALGSFINSANTISILFYSVYLYAYYRSKNKLLTRELRTARLKLLRLIIIFFGIFSVIALANLWIRMTLSNHPIITDFIMSLLISFFIYTIGYLGFNNSALMRVFDKELPAMYSSSKLKANDADLLLSKLIGYLEQQQPYLKEGYKISELSSETDIPSHHISELLNKYHRKSFSDVINEYRIREAKKLLLSDHYRNTKVSAVGFDVGFNSPSTFYSWFKKITGTSPASYQKEGLG
ncbi:helix-turn-helix domain-containing protein [Leptobacterium flavescens]|uniref:Helix-turn-helix domain-containing protein n=1 Tax=Leptobacterium flavescens TaxID=472055 RepID=A0A6P0ULS5_9FLAO|nr:helix-turn-helix domain-containing protein [Leptobacterium flavescens]NER13482.1 helix-turn-helix domain-containing protein [Leptobacterium flavescens]